MTAVQQVLLMAGGRFPKIVTHQGTAGSGASTSLVMTMPTGIVAGDLLICIGGWKPSGSATTLTATGWTVARTVTGTRGIACLYKVAVGGDTCTLVPNSASGIGGWIGRIDKDSYQGVPEGNTGNATVDPDAIVPSWGAFGCLVIAGLTIGGDGTVSAYPSGYDLYQNTSKNGTSSNDSQIATACAELVGASFNPGTFTSTGTSPTSITVAVRRK